MDVASYVLFFLGGLGFGFAAPGGWKWLPLAFPLGLFVIAVLEGRAGRHGRDQVDRGAPDHVAGVLLGALLEHRSGHRQDARLAWVVARTGLFSRL